MAFLPMASQLSLGTASIIQSNNTHPFFINSTVPKILENVGLQIDNGTLLITIATTLSIILFLGFLITDIHKFCRYLRKRRQTAFKSTLVLELMTVDDYMTIDVMDIPSCPSTLDFSRLRSPTDIDAFPSIRNSFINLDWDYASVTDLSTDQQFAIPQRIAVGYFKALKIKKILCHPYNAYLYIRHCDKIVLIPKCIPSKPNIPKLTQASHPQTSDFKVQMPQLEFQPKVFSLYPKLPMDSLEDTVVQTVTYKIPQY